MEVLYFTKSSGYEHSVISEADGRPSYSQAVLDRLGADNGITFTTSKDGSLFSPDYLAGFDAFMFYTSGDLFSVGADGASAMTPAGKQALIDAVAGGKGFLAIHSGADTFHTGESGPGNSGDRSNRYKLHGDDADPYLRMLGGEFINHGQQQTARARVTDPAFPGCGGLGEVWECYEEWYSLKEFADNLHVLLVMESETMEGVDYQRPPYPLAWAREYGAGRVWFNGMGHREDIWDSAAFQAMLLGGLQWAARRIDADVTPNRAAVTPEADTLPPQRPGT